MGENGAVSDESPKQDEPTDGAGFSEPTGPVEPNQSWSPRPWEPRSWESSRGDTSLDDTSLDDHLDHGRPTFERPPGDPGVPAPSPTTPAPPPPVAHQPPPAQPTPEEQGEASYGGGFAGAEGSPQGFGPPAYDQSGNYQQPPYEQPLAYPPPEPHNQPGPYGQPAPYVQPPPYQQPTQPPAPYGQPSPYQPAPYGNGFGAAAPYGMVPTTQPQAQVALVLGLLGFLCPLSSIPAIVLALSSKKKIAAEPQRYSGSGLATAGLVLGILGSLGLVIYFIAFISSLNLGSGHG